MQFHHGHLELGNVDQVVLGVLGLLEQLVDVVAVVVAVGSLGSLGIVVVVVVEVVAVVAVGLEFVLESVQQRSRRGREELKFSSFFTGLLNWTV